MLVFHWTNLIRHEIDPACFIEQITATGCRNIHYRLPNFGIGLPDWRMHWIPKIRWEVLSASLACCPISYSLCQALWSVCLWLQVHTKQPMTEMLPRDRRGFWFLPQSVLSAASGLIGWGLERFGNYCFQCSVAYCSIHAMDWWTVDFFQRLPG